MSAAQSGMSPKEAGDLLARLGPEDFAGGTAFEELSVEQKLLWLAHAASFALEAREVRSEQEKGPSRRNRRL